MRLSVKATLKKISNAGIYRWSNREKRIDEDKGNPL